MNKRLKYMILGGFVVALVAILFFTLDETKSTENYARSLRKYREQRDKDFKYGSSSPLTDDQKHKFTVLDYFSPDEKYKVVATITPTNNDSVYRYLTTSNEIRRFYKYAYVDFTIDQTPQRLLLLKSAESSSLNFYLLAFKDLTTATESYEGGRYVDIDTPKSNKIEIDFNKAYNPYCAYNDMYSCPVPPDENNLSVRILAGERKYMKQN
jgi:uncharacterized protein (DUF1684 family)